MIKPHLRPSLHRQHSRSQLPHQTKRKFIRIIVKFVNLWEWDVDYGHISTSKKDIDRMRLGVKVKHVRESQCVRGTTNGLSRRAKRSSRTSQNNRKNLWCRNASGMTASSVQTFCERQHWTMKTAEIVCGTEVSKPAQKTEINKNKKSMLFYIWFVCLEAMLQSHHKCLLSWTAQFHDFIAPSVELLWGGYPYPCTYSPHTLTPNPAREWDIFYV